MACASLNLLLLLSAPSDVPVEHLAIIRQVLTQWNVSSGRPSGTAVLPLSWSDHAVSEYGERPQGIINKQLVDEADVLAAVFSDRLGTPTGEAGSDTVEEIQRMVDVEKQVSALLNLCPQPPLAGGDAVNQKARLEEYLASIRGKALYLPYASEVQLAQLSRFTGEFEQSAADSRGSDESTSDLEDAGVWPRIEVTERPETDSRGHLRGKRSWYLVLENMTGRPVQNVTFRFEGIEETALFRAHGAGEPVEVLPPGGTLRYPMLLAMGSPDQARCVMSWTDSRGDHETVATVRA